MGRHHVRSDVVLLSALNTERNLKQITVEFCQHREQSISKHATLHLDTGNSLPIEGLLHYL